jgi:hypothetical protein
MFILSGEAALQTDIGTHRMSTYHHNISMKKYLSVLTLVGLLIRLAAAEDMPANAWGAATNGVQMSIVLRPNRPILIQSTNSVTLTIFVRNTSTNKVYFFLAGSIIGPDLFLVITSPSGKKIQPRPGTGSSSGGFDAMFPNETREFDLELNKLYPLNEVGSYTVIAEMGMYLPQQANPFVVFSNPLRLSVIQDKH